MAARRWVLPTAWLSCLGMYWIALLSLVVATGFDLRKREIPDLISIALLAVAVGAKVLGLHPVAWSGILLGAAGAFVVTATLFALGGLGGGDVKLFTALGAALGAGAFLPFAMATALFGGLVALVLRRRRRRGAPERKLDLEFAYAPIMLGGLLALLPILFSGG